MKKTQAVMRKNVTQKDVNNYLFYLLGRQDYTESKLRTKLKERFPHQPEMHDNAIEAVIEMGGLNELRFGEMLIKGLLFNNLGPQKIKERLYVKGFSRENIEKLLESSVVSNANHSKSAMFWREKWYGDRVISDSKEYKKAMSKLLRKGFDYSDVSRALKMEDDF